MNEKIIIGIDEAGRGALVGRVYAGCVYVPKNFPTEVLKDSKKLTSKQREEARELIIKNCIYAIGYSSESEVDKLNILNATFLAMQRAFEDFSKKAHELLEYENVEIIVDGNKLPPFLKKYENSLFSSNINASCMIKGDDRIHSIMAASILAKTQRDYYMLEMDKKYPQYDFKTNKGYGTKNHRDAIKKYGPAPIARKSFSVS